MQYFLTFYTTTSQSFLSLYLFIFFFVKKLQYRSTSNCPSPHLRCPSVVASLFSFNFIKPGVNESHVRSSSLLLLLSCSKFLEFLSFVFIEAFLHFTFFWITRMFNGQPNPSSPPSTIKTFNTPRGRYRPF